MVRLKTLFGGNEDKLSTFFEWIQTAKLGLRRGTEAKNACYALSDFSFANSELLKQLFWIKKPFTKEPEKTNEWYEHLYNTVLKIMDLEQSSTAPLLLASPANGGGEGSEHYKVAIVGIGDGNTFGKAQIPKDAQKVGEGFELQVNDDSFESLKATVDNIIRWMISTMDSLN